MLPNIEIGLKRSGRSFEDIDLGGYGFIGCATTDSGIDRVRAGLKERVALYASTPEYEQMLDMHGWDVKLSDFIDMARQHKWKEMGNLVSDEMLEAYAVVEKPENLPDALKKRYGGYVNRIQIDETWFDGLSDEQVGKLVAQIKEV